MEVNKFGRPRDPNPRTEDLYAFFEAIIVWCPAEIDKITALGDPGKYMCVDKVEILASFPNDVKEGQYDKLGQEKELFTFSEHEERAA